MDSRIAKVKQLFDSGNRFPWFLAAILYTISWGWSFLFLEAYFWDDWVFFYNRTPAEHAALWAGEEKHFINPWLNPLLLELGLWSFRVLAFLFMFGAGVCLFQIVKKLGFFSLNECKLLSLIFILLPINPARYSVQTFEYSLSYFFFFLGWYLLVCKPNRFLRLLVPLALALAVGTPSLLVFCALPIIDSLTKAHPKSRSEITRWILRHIDLFVVPLAFGILFRDSQGTSQKYGVSKFGLLDSIMSGVILLFVIGFVLRKHWSSDQAKRIAVLVTAGITLVWLATIPYWAIGYNPIQEWVPGIFSIRARDWFSPLSHLTQIGGIGLAVLAFIIISKVRFQNKGVLVFYLTVGIFLFSNYQLGPMDWDSRIRLLWPLGLAVVAIGLLGAVPLQFQRVSQIILLIGLVATSATISAEYYVDSLKQNALIESIGRLDNLPESAVIVVYESDRKLNARERKIRNYEWSGMVNSAFPNRTTELVVVTAKEIDVLSCPVIENAVLLSPTIMSSRLSALLKRKVALKIDLKFEDIHVCPD
jgi:hypothetical protein